MCSAMTRTSLDHHNCSLARTIDIIGDRWSLMIIRDAFYGVRQFSRFKERLGITQAVLSSRLTNLVDHGILERSTNDATTVALTYALTAKGRALFPVIVGLVQWGDDWIHSDIGPPIVLADRDTGKPIDRLQVTLGHEPVQVRDITFFAGPGANADTHAAISRAKSRG
jgi:DNA-binding HxlR family transcriptional regulator